jgi:flagellin
VGANANQTITATSGNFQTSAYGNYRIGGLVAFNENGSGDLIRGSTAGSQLTQFGTDGNTSKVAANETLSIQTSSGTYSVGYTGGTVGTNAITSAAQLAAQINQAQTGVNASAITSFVLGSDASGGGGAAVGFMQKTSYSFLIATDTASATPSSYTTVSFTTGGTDSSLAVSGSDQLNAAAQAFNDVAGKTGLTAKLIKTDNTTANFALQMTNESGADVRIVNNSATAVNIADTKVVDGDATNSGNTQALAAGNNASTWTSGSGSWVTGQLILDSDKSFSVTSTTAQFMLAATTSGSQLQYASKMDVSTVDAANRTLAIVDSALASVNNQRARYGALQSRFENTISNLQTTSENLSASRSRIKDADFAEETAKLTRAQILQQAGIAMLSQANALPQQVLTLLRG